MKKQEILTFDFETTTLLRKKDETFESYRNRLKEFNSSVYAWAVCKRLSLDNYEIKDGISIFSFLEYITSIKVDTTMYAHNGSKFDFHFIIPYLEYVGYKQLIVKNDNLSAVSKFAYENMSKYKNIVFEEKYRKFKPMEYSMLVDGSHKIMELKIALNSTKRKKDGTKEQRLLILRDSNLMFPAKLLDYGKTLNKHFNTERFSKLELEGGYKKETLYKNYNEFANDKNERNYLHRDVIILSEFISMMIEILPFHKWKMTAAGTAYSIWKNDYIGKTLLNAEIEKGNIVEVITGRGYINYTYKNSRKMHPRRYFVNILFNRLFPVSWLDSFFIDEISSNFGFIHNAYQGGITMANPSHAGKIVKNVIQLDIKSSYPDKMLNDYYPYGTPIIGDDNNPDSMKLINLSIESVVNDKGLPFIYDFLKVNGGKHYPKKVMWKDFLITDVEFKRFQKYYKGKYTWDIALSFNRIKGSYLFGEYVNHFYALKSKVGATKAEIIFAKLMLVAVYGKFGQDVIRNSKLYLGGEWKTIETISEATYYLPVVCWITAYGRMHLVDAAGYNFQNIITLDTDSLSIEVPHNIYNSSMSVIKKYIESNYDMKLDDKKLGYWDIKFKMSKLIARRAKQYMFYDDKGKKFLVYAGLRLNEEQLETLSFKDFVLGKEKLEQLRPFRTPTGLVIESYDKQLKPIWEYDLDPDYHFKDKKTFLKSIDIKDYVV